MTRSACVFATYRLFSSADVIRRSSKDSDGCRPGRYLPGATVTRHQHRNRRRTTVMTDDAGHFPILRSALRDVRSSECSVTAFAIYTRRPIQVTVGQTVTIDAALAAGVDSGGSSGAGRSPGTRAGKDQQSDTITAERIENLPINRTQFPGFRAADAGRNRCAGAGRTFAARRRRSSGLSFLGQGGRSQQRHDRRCGQQRQRRRRRSDRR